MTNLKQKLVTSVATVAILANGLTPLAFADEYVISGNGAGSDNWITTNQSSTTVVTQTNNAGVENNVDADAKTGGNDANFNTGGDVTIDTGDADVDVNVVNTLNSNSAEVDCCASGDTSVLISGNGAKSDNGVQLTQGTTTVVTQTNNANVTNNVDADAKTGGNDANKNTGGDVTITTGNASANASVSTLANVNSAVVSSNGGGNPSASFIISGNGAYSDNYITANLAKTTVVTQTNNAKIENNVDADAKTGGNDANFNTGGDVTIDTGKATVDVNVDNAVNFNHADVDCGCTWDVLAKIVGNGAEDNHHNWWWWWNDPDNLITLNLASAQVVTQGNNAGLENNVDGDAKTGGNEAELNTGDPESDPSILTGDAMDNVDVSNSGNVNSVGDLLPWDWPDWPSEWEFSFSFAAMMAFFGLSL